MQELETQALSVLDAAKAMPPVTNDDDYRRVGEFILGAKQLIAKITDAHKPSIDAAHQAHKAAIALRDSHIHPINQALAVVQPLAIEYKRQQDKLAAEAAARKAAEDRKAKEEQALIDAEYLSQLGDEAAAEKALNEAVAPVRMTPVALAVPKIAGLSTRKKWKCRIIRPGNVKPPYLMPNEKMINIKVDMAFHGQRDVTPAMITALEVEIGGIEVYQEETFAGVRTSHT